MSTGENIRARLEEALVAAAGVDVLGMASRRQGDAGRLNVELRLLGMVAFTWTCALAQAVLWGWIGIGFGELPHDIPWAALLVPQALALATVLGAITALLPKVRWQRRGSLMHTPTAVPLLAAGALALPFVPLLIWRDRRVRRSAEAPGPDDIERAFHSLLRLPRAVGLQFLAWGGMAFIGDAIILSVHLGWSREQAVALAVLWLALLGPLAAIVHSRTRAILRPEFLTAPRPSTAPFRRITDLKLRLAVPASIASIGAVAAPLMAGYLWMHSIARSEGVTEAESFASRMVVLASLDQEEELGRLLGRNPGATLQKSERSYGKQRDTLPVQGGVVDEDGDHIGDVFVRQSGGITAIVPIGRPSPLRLDLLMIVAFVCIASSVGSVVLVARDAHRDVSRASQQVDAVAAGRAPAPLGNTSFSTHEIRELVQSVDRLVSRITEANVAKYVAIEKAREADRLKSQFLANMSHDLRSPLNSILGFSELLLTGIDGDITADQRQMVQMVHDSGRELLQQIDDILDTAKIDAGRMEMHAEPTPASTLVSRAITNARRRQNNRLDYETEIAAGLPPAFVDPFRTVQALENVLLFGSVRMSEGTVRVKLRLGNTEAGRMLFIQIKTPVQPATAEQLSLALRGFHRIPGHRGLGLSLPIAGAILELEGGSLGIEELADGMVFSIQIPAPETRRRLKVRSPSGKTGTGAGG